MMEWSTTVTKVQLALQESHLALIITMALVLITALTWRRPERELCATTLGELSFAWMDSLLLKGWHNRGLKLQDMPSLGSADIASANAYAFQEASQGPSLLSRLLRHFQKLFAIQSIWAILYGVLIFVPTLLLQTILQYVEDKSKITVEQAWLYVALLFFTSILAAVAEGRALWIGQKIGFRLRSIIISEIYAKALRRRIASSLSERTEKSPPGTETAPQADVATIMNLLTTDAFKIADAGASMHQVWGSVPVQILIAISLLYSTLGFSALAGVALMTAVVPLNSQITRQFGAIQLQVMAASDRRIQSTTEMVRSIRVIKFFAWESCFEQRIDEKRTEELRALRARYILWSIAATIWYSMPLLITFTSFFVYAIIEGKPLTPSLAFSSLSYFNLLKTPLDEFVGMLARIQDALVSVRRVEIFLKEPETGKYKQLPQQRLYFSSEIGFEHATFGWDSSAEDYVINGTSKDHSDVSNEFTLRDLNIKFASGQLNIITGPTGSGKSSMLLALLGEMTLIKGAVRMPAAVNREDLPVDLDSGLIDAVAYCAQEAWLTNDTIRNNILFGSPYNEERYRAVLDACALAIDLKDLAQGERTQVGERGISLSGGQKQRIALARATYSNACHLLLDDCLSAVDAHTAAWIFQHCIKGSLLKGRTCILVTHNLALAAADARFLVALENGKVAAAGAPSDLAKLGLHFPLNNSFTTNNDDQGSQRNHQFSDTPLGAKTRPEKIKKKHDVIQQEDADRPDGDVSVTEELQRNEKLSWRDIFRYFASMGGWSFWPLLVFSFIGQQFGAIATNWWVRNLSDAYTQAGQQATKEYSDGMRSESSYDCQLSPKRINLTYYFGMYGLIIGLYMVVGLLRLFLVSFGSLQASAVIHRRLIKSIMNASFIFFNDTSFGQIIGRFSTDLQIVDQHLAVLIIATLHFLGALAGIVILIAMTTPSFLVPGVPISIAYYLIGAVYIVASRDLKEFESSQRAPLFQHLGETLSGVTTIRAFGAMGQYSAGNFTQIDRANRPSFFAAATERWLSIRLGLIGAFVSLFASSFAISSLGKLSAGAIGLSMSYAIVFSEHVLWLVRYHSSNLQNVTALQRVQKYIDIPQQAPAVMNNTNLSEGWPRTGVIEYDNVSTRYAPGLDQILRELSFAIKPLEKIGIVGRTGAGKSSIVLTLLRGLEVENGQIRIDGVDTKNIGLRALRQRLATVPQDPILFAGTLRFNLDPCDEHTDEEVLRALDNVGLLESYSGGLARAPSRSGSKHSKPQDSTAITNKFADLSFVLAESGSNISQGQRQLICIARAILKASSILILDEATASIDHTTDLKIQGCIRKMGSTVITVAHRLRTVVEHDRIIVLDRGKVMEFDHPWKLLQREGGMFKSMCEAAMDKDDLLALAKAAWEASGRAKES
ncbi:MAG: hypothetical protein Q9187_004001 [Circinaria calcarea]